MDEKWYHAFNLALCYNCKGQDGLISKSKAKTMFLLNDADLRPLGSLEKPNPQHQSWSSMRMYLLSQVKRAAVKKHGSLSAIESAKDERSDRRFARQAERRKRGAGEDGQEEVEESRFAAKVEARAARLAREAEEAQRVQIEETVDPDTGAKRRRHGPQLAEVEFEAI